jgi:hypothetical protein
MYGLENVKDNLKMTFLGDSRPVDPAYEKPAKVDSPLNPNGVKIGRAASN